MNDSQVIDILTERGTKPELYAAAGRFVAVKKMFVGHGFFSDRDETTIRAEFERWQADDRSFNAVRQVIKQVA